MVDGGDFVEIMGLTSGGRAISGNLGTLMKGLQRRFCLWRH